MPFNTGNPVPSNAGEDLDDNSRFFDEFAAGASPSATDRLGTSRKTIAGMESEFNADQAQRVSEFNADQSQRASEFSQDQSQRASEFNADQNDRASQFAAFIAASGYEFLGDYAAGIEITGYQQVVRDTSGEFWRLSGSTELPYTTTGAGLPEGGSFVAVGDAALRQDLANPDKGAAMLARGVVAVDSIADLLALPEGQRGEGLRYLVKGYHAGSDVGGGEFYWDPAKTDENDGVLSFNGFIRVRSDRVSVLDAGASGTGVSDDSPAIQSLIDLTETTGYSYIYFPNFDEQYRLSSALRFHLGDIRIFGDKGQQFVHPFLDGTPQRLRKGNLIVEASAECGLDLGDSITAETARNRAMAFTVEGISLHSAPGVARSGDAILWTAVQNGPHRPLKISDVSAYDFDTALKFVAPPPGVTIILANLSVKDSTFSFNKRAVHSDGPVFGANFHDNNFEANTDGCISGWFSGVVSIKNNMLENTKNPIDLSPMAGALQVEASGNYFEYHPTSDFLYRLRGDSRYIRYSLSAYNDILSGGIPQYPIRISGTGRFSVETDRHRVKFSEVSGMSMGVRNNVLETSGEYTFDGGFQQNDHSFVAAVDGWEGRQDMTGEWLLSYPAEGTGSPVDTPVGRFSAVDLADGFQVGYGESVYRKIVCTNFLIRTQVEDVQSVARNLNCRTPGGAFVGSPGSMIDYIHVDMSRGKWVLVSLIWRPINDVSTIEFYVAEALRGQVFVAAAASKVVTPYAADGSDPVFSVNPVCPPPPDLEGQPAP